MKPKIPSNEQDRLQALWDLHLLDTAPEERFDVITKKAVEKMHMPISMVTLLDKDREWYKSCQGINSKEMPRENSFCAHTLGTGQLLIVEDTHQDERFADNPQVTKSPFIRFYAGVPLHERKSGMIVGVFCVKDTKPRKLSQEEFVLLFDLAHEAEDELMNAVK